jgi:hypothetical protein
VILKLDGTDMLPRRKGATTEELLHVAKVLQDDGIDAIEISRAHYESWPGMVLGHCRGFIRGQIEEGSGDSMSRTRRTALLAASPLIERAAERLAPPERPFHPPPFAAGFFAGAFSFFGAGRVDDSRLTFASSAESTSPVAP